ncbi:GntR family transcriptional regulator [Amycolatopsis sp. La24]|uniref:GntR family transcriptional regulator n=1 Tax=Amycolatopsis sp. La24 TaxID=3028304 RepID=UPI0023AF0CA1|nr:GntR family transcriptional regulator [Amycolatopsis sp. La24]
MAKQTAGLAAYERVAAAIRAAVTSGELAPGKRLPGNRVLAEQYDVSLPTLQKAVGVLQDEGWLVTRASVGVYVADEPPAEAPPASLKELGQTVVELRASLRELTERVQRIEDETSAS